MAKNNKQKKKNYSYNGRDEMITFEQLIESRKQEMEHILPGYYSVVTDPRMKKKDVKVYSPSIWKRGIYSIIED